MLVVLGAALAVLLTVVILRTETSRLHNEIAGLERKIERRGHDLRAVEMELARLRNPMLLRLRVQEVSRQLAEQRADDAGDSGQTREREAH